MICDSCGNNLPQNAAFCPRCGKTMAPESSMGTIIADKSNVSQSNPSNPSQPGFSQPTPSQPGFSQPTPSQPGFSQSDPYSNNPTPYVNYNNSGAGHTYYDATPSYANQSTPSYTNAPPSDPYTNYNNPYAPPPPPPLVTPPVKKPEGNGKKVLGIISIVAIVVLAACGGLTFASVNFIQSLGTTSSPTSVVQNSTPTATTAAATPTTNPSGFTLPSNAKLVLEDSLKDNTKGIEWEEFNDDAKSLYCQFENGGYRTRLIETSKYTTTWCLAQNTSYGNMAYQADVTLSKGVCSGLIFHNTGNDQQYYFCVRPTGGYSLYRYAPGADKDKTDIKELTYGTSSAINKGYNVTNKVAIIVDSGTIKMSVNDRLIKTIDDSSYTSGRIGVAAHHSSKPSKTEDRSTDVTFKNIKVWTW